MKTVGMVSIYPVVFSSMIGALIHYVVYEGKYRRRKYHLLTGLTASLLLSFLLIRLQALYPELLMVNVLTYLGFIHLFHVTGVEYLLYRIARRVKYPIYKYVVGRWRMYRYLKENPKNPSVLAFKTVMKYIDGRWVKLAYFPGLRRWRIVVFSPDKRMTFFGYDDDVNFIVDYFLEDLKEYAERYGGIYSKIYEDVKVKLLPFLV